MVSQFLRNDFDWEEGHREVHGAGGVCVAKQPRARLPAGGEGDLGGAEGDLKGGRPCATHGNLNIWSFQCLNIVSCVSENRIFFTNELAVQTFL